MIIVPSSQKRMRFKRMILTRYFVQCPSHSKCSINVSCLKGLFNLIARNSFRNPTSEKKNVGGGYLLLKLDLQFFFFYYFFKYQFLSDWNIDNLQEQLFSVFKPPQHEWLIICSQLPFKVWPQRTITQSGQL